MVLVRLVRLMIMILVVGGTFSSSQEELEVIVAGGGGILRGSQAELDILLANILSVVGRFAQAGPKVAVADRVLDEAVQEAGPGRPVA